VPRSTPNRRLTSQLPEMLTRGTPRMPEMKPFATAPPDMDAAEAGADSGDLDETITIARSPRSDLGDEDSVPLHLWAVRGGLHVEHVGLFMLLAMLHKQTGAAPDEVGEVSPDEFYELASRPQEDPELVQTAIEELEQRHMLVRRDGRWLFSQLAAVLFDAGHDAEAVRERVDAAVAAWLRERAS